jgi:hypothetical protein
LSKAKEMPEKAKNTAGAANQRVISAGTAEAGLETNALA